MYKILDADGTCYSPYHYEKESEYEEMIVSNANAIFGENGIYFNIKKRVGASKKGASVPDGYYLDLLFHETPKLYFVEVELSDHDLYAHIGPQILRFGIASEMDKHKIKTVLLEDIQKDPCKRRKLEEFFQHSSYKNSNQLLDKVIFETSPSVVVIIDEVTEELNNVLAQLTISTEVIEVNTYVSEGKKLCVFTPFREEVITDIPEALDADELDTVVVPARKEGFEREFLANQRWFEIRISPSMLDKIRYIAAYQVAPVSAITYIAEVERIEKYKDTGRYILYFKRGSLQKLEKIPLGRQKELAPRNTRYTSRKKLETVRTLDELWKTVE